MRVLPRSACFLLLLASAAASAGTVYKWKDANGVTQYSETPPTGQKFESRRMTDSGTAIPAPGADAPAESQQCLDARRNLELLAGKGPVTQPANADGSPGKALDDNQRNAQKQLAEAAATAYCRPAAQG
jgi:hypothetical protein